MGLAGWSVFCPVTQATGVLELLFTYLNIAPPELGEEDDEEKGSSISAGGTIEEGRPDWRWAEMETFRDLGKDKRRSPAVSDPRFLPSVLSSAGFDPDLVLQDVPE
ncbi:hypothetical protein CCHR01_15766 [Colletotrichum chrysophilum]|uniref:Uncharacterized protein n=1 Tax=Colletotrichum chrysophilum TaxID=1836956 RepID=A0AAD9A7M9_9PEZI|nr:hypothetical protein CCHR01_15766 [Colletotrichum chrysophilum]